MRALIKLPEHLLCWASGEDFCKKECPFHQLNRSVELKKVKLVRERDYIHDCTRFGRTLYTLSSIVKPFSFVS